MTRWLFIFCLLLSAAVSAIAGDLGKTLVVLDGKQVASQETALGNFVADAIRNASVADIAIVHAMAFRTDTTIAQGIVSDQTIRGALLAPSSKIVTMELSPATLRDVMKRALKDYPNPNTAFLQFSGMEVVFNSGKKGDSRLEAIRIHGTTVDLNDNTTTFNVAMPRELAIGAAGYVLLFTDDVTKTMKISNDLTMLGAITQEFTRQKGEVAPKIERRLKDSRVPGM